MVETVVMPAPSPRRSPRPRSPDQEPGVEAAGGPLPAGAPTLEASDVRAVARAGWQVFGLAGTPPAVARATTGGFLLAVASQDCLAQCFVTALVPAHRCGAVPAFNRVPSCDAWPERAGSDGPARRPGEPAATLRIGRPGAPVNPVAGDQGKPEVTPGAGRRTPPVRPGAGRTAP